MSTEVLAQLAATISARRSACPEQSYTRRLLDAGAQRCAKKLGEEAVETVIAGISESEEALKEEAADLIYHLLVLLECRGVTIADVLSVLEQRRAISGLDEKAKRPKR